MFSKPLAAACVLGACLIGWTAVVSLGIVGPPETASPDGGAAVGGSTDLAAPPAIGAREALTEPPSPSELVAFEQAPASLPESPSAPHKVAEESVELELIRLRTRIEELEAQLTSLHTLRFLTRQLEEQAALEPEGQIGLWAASVAPGALPDEHTRLVMASMLHDYPVELQAEEGLWLAERIRVQDWHLWGPSVDEAIIAFLGAERIAQARTGGASPRE